jgi:hypothetical protein
MPTSPVSSLRRWAASAAAAALLSLPALSSMAAEGMWTLDNLPLAAMKARYGFSPDAAWVDRVMRSSARLAGGCSASFVSPQGLVMTNHHCAIGCVQQLSSPQQDRVAEGFLARERSQELRCPEAEINRLEAIVDVTAPMKAATAGKSGTAFQAAQDAESARLTKDCRGPDAETVRCDLVTLYHGGQYQLYRYHRYSDVRLVWAPEEPIAAFGGDPDNFNFPRFDLDVTMLRVYEGGQPAAIKDWFRFKPEGAQPGELTLVTGHPGSTERQLTVAQLERLRDDMALQRLPYLSELRGVLLQYAKGGPEPRRLAATRLAGVENSLKVVRGELEALSDPLLMATKRREEQALKDFVAARPELSRQVGDPWSAIARAQQVRRDTDVEFGLIEYGSGFSARYFGLARTLVRGAAERARPNAERLREFSDTALPQIEQRLRSPAPLYPEFERNLLEWSLTRMRSVLGADHALVQQVLGRRSPEQVAAALVEGTRLAEPAERLRLWQGGQAAIDQSDDPFIRLALAIDPAARALRRRHEAEVQSVEREAAQRVAAAGFARTGRDAYPDATFTLRLSYGEVQGWEVRGQPVPPYTDVAGLYRRATGEAPFALPPSWLAAQGRLDPAQRFNLVTTNDIIGGNSGSPMINRQGEIVGLVFDGNIESLGGAYSFDERVNRAVSVHSGIITESLRRVYGADALLQELLGTKAGR